jgi:WD40 repeat protein
MASDRLHTDDVRALDVLIEPKQVVKSFSGTSRKIPSMPALVTTSFDGTAALWGVSHSQTGLPMTGATGGNSDRGRFDRLSLLSGAHTDKVLGVCVLQQSQNILTSGADGVVALWSPPAGR